MPVEEIIRGIERQREIILRALREQDRLVESLRNADREAYDWMSVKAAADMLDVSPCVIYARINSRRLTVKHIGAKKFVKKSEVTAIDDRYMR